MMLELDGVTHRYGEEPAVEDVSFGIDAGELVALVGPSGCGKTTLVQAVAGHVRPTAGRIRLRGEDVTDRPPEARRVGLVFQQQTLYPHMTAGENVAYGLAAQNVEPDRRADIVAEYLDLVDLSAHREAYPGELSGGQQRRVELARALAPEPDVLLLDEPLSALDRGLRVTLREEIDRIQRETGVTTLFVTHDQEEAMALADRLVVLNEGRIAGIGQPRTLYESPPNRFVASFLGRSNTLSGTVTAEQPLTIEIGRREVPVQNGAAEFATVTEGTTVTCHVRPDDLSIRENGETNGTNPTLEGEVVRVTDVGRRYDVTVEASNGERLVIEQATAPPEPSESVAVEVSPSNLTVFCPERVQRHK